MENVVFPHVQFCTPIFLKLSYIFSFDLTQFYKIPSFSYETVTHSNNLTLLKFRPLGKHWPNCLVLLIFINLEFDQLNLLEKIGEQLTPTQKNLPILYKDSEKVFFVHQSNKLDNGESFVKIERILKSKFSKGLKHKVLLDLNQNQRFTACEFCGEMKMFVLGEKDKIVFPDFQNNLNLYPIRISVGESVRSRLNYTKDENGSYILTTGPLVPVIQTFAAKLNFTYKLKPSLRGGGTGIKYPNGSWDGMVADVMSGDADISISVAETFDRSQVVGFTSVVIWEHLALIISQGKISYHWAGVFWPLSKTVWILIVSFSVMSVVFLQTTHKLLSPTPAIGICWSFSTSICGIFLAQAQKLPRNLSISSQIYLSFWFISSISLTTTYLSMLVNFLTFPVQEILPTNIQELVSQTPSYSWGLAYVGGAEYSLINSSKVPVLQTINKRMQLMRDHSACYKRVVEEKFACLSYVSLAKVTSIYKSEELSDKYGNSIIRISPNYIFSFAPGIMTRKRSIFSPNLEIIIQALKATGFPEKWEEWNYQNLLQSRKQQTKDKNLPSLSKSTEDDTNLLTLKHLKGAQVIYITGIILTVLIFLIEELANCWYPRNTKIF